MDKGICARCKAEGQEPQPVMAREMCRRHYLRAYRAGEFKPGPVGMQPQGRKCTVKGCDRPHKGHGLCRRHLYAAVREGKVDGKPRCAGPECDLPAVAHDLCQAHRRQERKGLPLTPFKPRQPRGEECGGPECDKPVKSAGLCDAHYYQQRVGRPLTPIRKPKPKGSPCEARPCPRPAQTDGLCRTHYTRRLSGHPRWADPIPDKAPAGAGTLNPAGYRIIANPGRPGRRVPEHRWVVQTLLGRELLPEENVHHLNGVRHDNRPENLELWTRSQPPGQRVDDKVAFAREMLALYGTPEERARYAEHAPPLTPVDAGR